eukprot:34056-Pelagomonas_calceolata.AAC.1
MPSKNGHMPLQRKWPLPWTITLNTYTTQALIPVTFFLVPNIIPSSRFLGISICHICDDKAMTLALQHAIYSAILNTEATATF